MTTQDRKTICPLDCPDACGIVAHVNNEEIVKIQGDKDHPFTNGFLCEKVRTYHQRVQSPDRVLYPQKRVGLKGEGKFQRISWDEAYDMIVDRLTYIKEQFGGEALLPYSYAGNMGKVSRAAGDAFCNRYGASQLLQTICSTAAKEGWNRHYGKAPASPPEKAQDADLIIAWGINIKVTNIHFMPFVNQARKKGAKLIVIDPYKNITASNADEHIILKPGGDAALALGLLKLLISWKAIDEQFIQNYSDGFDELNQYVNSISLEEFCDNAGVSLTIMESLARQIKENPKTFIRIGIGITRNSRGAMSVSAIACLAAAMGLFDGGSGKGALLSSGAFTGDDRVLSHPELKTEPTRKINMVQLGDALTSLSPALKCLIVYNSNPLSVAPDAKKVREGLSRNDLFTIVHEQFLTPTARYADLLLPATTCFENEDIYTGYGHFYINKIEPIIKPQGEAVDNFTLFQTLAQKMGYDEPVFQETVKQRVSSYTETISQLSQEVRSQGMVAGVTYSSNTMSKGGDYTQFTNQKFQFIVEEKNTRKKIPYISEGIEADNKELMAKYPYIIITPPMKDLLNSTFGERYKNEVGFALIHPSDAEKEKLSDNEWVRISNHRGKHLRRVSISDKTQPGLIVLEGIYWENEHSNYTGVNDLTSQAITDAGEGGTFHEARVKIEGLGNNKSEF